MGLLFGEIDPIALKLGPIAVHWYGVIIGMAVLLALYLSIKEGERRGIQEDNFYDFLIVALFAVVLFASCERVAPNYAGVLMENYGKQGKEDFKIVAGKVSTWELGTELFQVPLFDQRGEFSDPVTLKAADNTEFTARPTYSYKVMKNRAIDIVFDNKHIDKADTPSGKDGFMQSLEDNILEPRIYDLIKEESRKHKTDQAHQSRSFQLSKV